MDLQVMKALTGITTCKLKNEKDLLSKNPSSFTATISGVDKVYSLFPGTVLFLGYYEKMGTITIAVSNHEIVRYLNVREIDVWRGDTIVAGRYLAVADAKSGLQFEYCSQWQGTSKYPVRINNRTYFKQNPISILNGLYIPYLETKPTNGINLLQDTVEFTDAQKEEFEDARQEIPEEIELEASPVYLNMQWEIEQGTWEGPTTWEI